MVHLLSAGLGVQMWLQVKKTVKEGRWDHEQYLSGPYTESNTWWNTSISSSGDKLVSMLTTDQWMLNGSQLETTSSCLQKQSGHFLVLFFWVRPINQCTACTFPPPPQCFQLIQMISTGNPKGQSIHLHISILCPIRSWLTHASIALVKTLLIAAPASHPSSTTSARGPSRQHAAQECNNTLNDCLGSSHPSQPIKKTAAAPRESTRSLRWQGWSWCLWEKGCGGWLWRESRHLFNWLCGLCVQYYYCAVMEWLNVFWTQQLRGLKLLDAQQTCVTWVLH